MELTNAPWGYDSWTHTEVTPKPLPITWHWRIGPVKAKTSVPSPSTNTSKFIPSEVTMQLTADQQVQLTISGEDRYGNQVDLSGDVVWLSSDESIIQVTNQNSTSATAVAVGPAGTASVTVTNDVDQDGTGDFQGSIAIDVVAGDIAEIVISASEPTDKQE
jgi:hypothetical protein